MNDDADGVAPRPRPLSGGLWTILSWLRRDEHDSSSESLSSAGSDRTAASFAFLNPVHYSMNNTNNVLPAIGPPTDSYKKRVQERNVRRQYERDLTLHRKYGLYRSEGGTGYDTFTLQQYRRIDSDSLGKWGRERRAASEGLQRRSVHVPGKRRAPLPPTYPTSVGGSSTLGRRTRKRRAPQPPNGTTHQPKEINKLNNTPPEMSSLNGSEHSAPTSDSYAECKYEKYVKKDTSHKDTKKGSEKSFLRQIFENRKRNPSTDTASIKILPSISELDKQAAEIIETGRLKMAQDNRIVFDETVKNSGLKSTKIKREDWFCTKCLKKYDESVKECSYCFPKLKGETAESVTNLIPYLKSEIYTQTDIGLVHPSTSKHHKIEDKQKLKEILKEMKDSLPKRSKQEKDCIIKTQNNALQENIGKCSIVSETPTLRIGSIDTTGSQYNEASSSGVEKNKNIKINQRTLPNIENIKVEQAVNLSNDVKSVEGSTKTTELLIKLTQHNASDNISSDKVNINKRDDMSKIGSNSSAKRDLHTPLRISALLNPVYIPKNKDSNKSSLKESIPTGSTSPDIKVNIENKIVPTTKVSLDSGTSNIVSSQSAIQTKSSNTDTQELKLETNKLLLKGEVKVDKRKIIIQPNPSISSNDMPQSKDVSAKLKPLKSYCKENKPNDPSSTFVLSTPASVCNPLLSSNIERVNQHARRRELVNQLEKSIAKGDESAAADAAVKLAQLRLSCSVLSFSSQIVTEPTLLPIEMPVNTKLTTATTYEEKEKVNNAIKPLNKIESKNENKNSNAKPHIVNNIKTTKLTPITLSVNKVRSVQGVKEGTAASATPQESIKNKVVNKDLVGQTTAREEIETLEENKNNISIQVWVEDKEATRGPIQLNTRRQAIMGELRMEAETALGLPSRLQRWIVGRTLCTDDNIPIVTLAGPEFNAPFYLCLVEPGNSDKNKPSTSSIQVGEKQTISEAQHNTKPIGLLNAKTIKEETIKAIDENKVKEVVQNTVKIMMQNEDQAANVYKELVKLEKQAIVTNKDTFECGVCMEECQPDQGVVLRECVHTFCRDCLCNLVRHCEDPDVFCPAMGCRGMLQEREIRALVSPEDYERWLARGLAAAESGTRNAFHCRTRDCTGWALCDPGVREFPCPVCNNVNCISCQTIHKDETCENYRVRLQSATNIDSDQIDVNTRALIDTLINKGEAVECPECKAVITKKWGCDWVKCSACKTEICWVTRGRRWGPAGRGDTSDGCRCGVDGKKCHPSCGYCH